MYNRLVEIQGIRTLSPIFQIEKDEVFYHIRGIPSHTKFICKSVNENYGNALKNV
jgi:hypothetical protein